MQPNSTDAQFFITNGTLSQSIQQAFDFNYTIFGQLVSGQQTVTDLSKVAVAEQLLLGPEDSQPITPVVINSVALSSTNPNGVLHIDTTSATAGQTATITVTATDPTDHTTATQSFTVTVGAYNGPTDPVINFVPRPARSARRPRQPASTVQLAGTSSYPDTPMPGTSLTSSSRSRRTGPSVSSTRPPVPWSTRRTAITSAPTTFQYQVIASGPAARPRKTAISLPEPSRSTSPPRTPAQCT